MDNLKYYNDSLAYDFNMFTVKEKKKKADIVKMPRKKTHRKAASVAIGERLRPIAVTIFVLGVICANIFLRVTITETTSKINKVKSEITELSGEQTRLNVEFESRISYKNIEQSAAALGMKKMDKSQVVYIKTNKVSAARTSDGKLSAAKD